MVIFRWHQLQIDCLLLRACCYNNVFYPCMQLSKEAVTQPTKQAPSPSSSAVKVPYNPAVNYLTLPSFSWEQDDDKVKVRICLPSSALLITNFCIDVLFAWGKKKMKRVGEAEDGFDLVVVRISLSWYNVQCCGIFCWYNASWICCINNNPDWPFFPPSWRYMRLWREFSRRKWKLSLNPCLLISNSMMSKGRITDMLFQSWTRRSSLRSVRC